MAAGDNAVNHWNIGWTLAFSFVALLVCITNVLIMVAFTTNALRKRSYYQVINLSVADLAVGIVVMPLYMGIQMTRSTNESLRGALYFTDPFFGLASFLILTIISCERLHAVAWPFKHRLLQKRHYAIALSLPWLIAAVDAAGDGWPKASWLPFPVFLVVISLGLAVICSSYLTLWIKKRSSTSRCKSRGLKNKELAKTLFITTVASLITWLPFYLYITHNFIICGEKCPVSYHLAFALKLLQFSNSFMNGVVYSLRMREFRGTIRRTFHRGLPSRATATNDDTTGTSAGENRNNKSTVAENKM